MLNINKISELIQVINVYNNWPDTQEFKDNANTLKQEFAKNILEYLDHNSLPSFHGVSNFQGADINVLSNENYAIYNIIIKTKSDKQLDKLYLGMLKNNLIHTIRYILDLNALCYTFCNIDAEKVFNDEYDYNFIITANELF